MLTIYSNHGFTIADEFVRLLHLYVSGGTCFYHSGYLPACMSISVNLFTTKQTSCLLPSPPRCPLTSFPLICNGASGISVAMAGALADVLNSHLGASHLSFGNPPHFKDSRASAPAVSPPRWLSCSSHVSRPCLASCLCSDLLWWEI